MSSLDVMFKTVAKSKWNQDRLKKREFEELKGPFLFSSERLNGLYDHDKNQYESILDHMYRFDACEVDSYADLEQKIIHDWWED